MVASEVEVPTFQLEDRIGTKSQRQFICFGRSDGIGCDGIGCDTDRPNRRLEIQDGGL